ncbi:hypothetical protein JC794_17675 [Morganella morganii]|uniref:hypothetical protein n=2 Tax=Morganella morganii TaxID=582 RepID=UPI0011B82D4A|nr:hypothetical protein [Morganella morganii]QXO45931.1 hypothetical protein JC862_16785 [Morganella morganii]QXO49606.1 hypothetical protein JC861_17605 [Morganella morganii]QXO53465.1 hypothetical protein JC830_17620 [Morganella morganii]QXO57293.1 hypothetical protein JC827_17690 [Morganella morganii]QXO61125.1 hypothetical protein JC826_16935 [Morganella morganii]
MNLVNRLSGAQKTTSEDSNLKDMSTIPFLNKLLNRLNAPQNTNVKFTGNYINIEVDTTKLSKQLLSFVYKSELSIHGIENKPEKAENTQKEINDGVKKWLTQEKSIIPVNIIKREVDLMYAEKKIVTTPEDLDKIIDIVKEKHLGNKALEKPGINCSTPSVLKLNSYLTGEINESGIKKKLSHDFTKSMPEMSENLKKELNSHMEKSLSHVENKELIKQYSAHKTDILNHHDKLTTMMTGKIRSDIYYALTENIYNTLLCDKYTETPLDFNAIREETRAQVLRIAEEKNHISPAVPSGSVDIDDIVHRSFDFSTRVTTSCPEQDITHVMDILKRIS